MVDLGRASAVLFESDAEDEALRIECASTDEGGLLILQESDGDLTKWCFEESPHRIEVEVTPAGAQPLVEYFHVDSVDQLPAVLRFDYATYDACQRLRDLMKHLGAEYTVVENPIMR